MPWLRPFFSYYGGKWRDALARYPRPATPAIVEPFAGSAGYSLRYPDRRVLLCDLDPFVIGVWEYLIRVSAAEVMAIPDVAPDGSVDDLPVCQEARWLVGFWLNRAPEQPRPRPSAWMRSGIRPGSFWGARVRQTIARQLSAIRHWRTLLASYEATSDAGEATWFVDPPYANAGRHYRFGASGIDYAELAAWCRARPGQVIVCETAAARWLPFEARDSAKTTRRDRRSSEAVWLGGTVAPE